MSGTETAKERIRPIFVVCPQCEGIGFILFDSVGFIGFEEPKGLIRTTCEKCGGTGEVVELQSKHLLRHYAEVSHNDTYEESHAI